MEDDIFFETIAAVRENPSEYEAAVQKIASNILTGTGNLLERFLDIWRNCNDSKEVIVIAWLLSDTAIDAGLPKVPPALAERLRGRFADTADGESLNPANPQEWIRGVIFHDPESKKRLKDAVGAYRRLIKPLLGNIAGGKAEIKQHVKENVTDEVGYVGTYFNPQTGKTYTGKEAYEQGEKAEKLLREKALRAGYTITTTMSSPADGEAEDNLHVTSKATKLEDAIRDGVFICYSHKDKRWLKDLQTHLKPFVRNNSVTAWSDKQIATGSKWFLEIEKALAWAKAGVLLVTPDFLASDFIHDHELGPLLERAEKGNVCIIWIPVKACAYKQTKLKDYQAACDPDKPLAAMKANRDKAWVEICEKIRDAAASQ